MSNVFSDQAVAELQQMFREFNSRMRNTRGHRGRWGGGVSQLATFNDTVGVIVSTPNYADGTSSTLELLSWNSDEIVLWSGNSWKRRRIDTASPPSVSSSGKSADTTHSIYAYWDTATDAVKIEAVTGDTTTVTDGISTKTGDQTRRWMGLARTNATPLWEDTQANRYVANFYIRRAKACSATVNTGGSADTNSIEVVISTPDNNWEIQLNYLSRITNTDVTGMPIASLDASGTLVSAYGLTLTETGTDIVTQYDIGLSLSYSALTITGSSGGKVSYVVKHTGGTITIQAGTFKGIVWN